MKKHFFLFKIGFILFTGLLLPGDLFSFSKDEKFLMEEFNQSLNSGFEENKGQLTDAKGNAVPEALFKLNGKGLDLYITTKGLTYVFYQLKENEEKERSREKGGERESVKEEMSAEMKWCRTDMILENAKISRGQIETFEEQAGVKNYFLSSCPDGILDVRSYHKILVHDVYPGIDWLIYSLPGKGLKYDFIIHPGADPASIVLQWEGKGKPVLSDDKKQLSIKIPMGKITEGGVVSFSGDSRSEVDTRFESEGKEIRFVLGEYNKNEELIIDPPLVWSTYFGAGALDGTRNILTDASGNIFIAGYVTSTTTPTLNPGGGVYFQGTSTTLGSAIIIKFSPTGVLLWSTYYGGSTNYSNAKSMCINNTGDLYVIGETGATNFPVYNPGSGAYFQSTNATPPGGMVTEDIFVLRFDNNGIRKWATYFGGEMQELGEAAIIDSNGDLLIVGTSNSTSTLPMLNPGGGAYYQSANGGGFDMVIARFQGSNNALAWSTYYGGTGGERGEGFAKDASGNIYMSACSGATAGMFTLNPGGGAYFQGTYSGGFSDAFFVRFSPAYNVQWATFFGGNNIDYGLSVTMDGCGNGVYFSGTTSSTVFPTLNPGGGAYYQAVNGGGTGDLFICKFNTSLALTWSTFLGGNASENGFGDLNGHRLAADNKGNVYIAGGSFSNNFPTVNPGGGAYYQGTFGGVMDMTLTQFNSVNAMTWSTYLGGVSGESAAGVCMDVTGNLYLAGEYCGVSTPTVNPGGGAWFTAMHGGSDDIGIAKFIGSTSPLVCTPTILNATCGASDGSVSLSVSGGVPAYSYSWNTGQTTDTVSGLAPGTYTITITDSDLTSCAGAGNQLTVVVTVTGAAGAPVATFSYAGPYCQNGTDPSPAYSGGGVAGTFTFFPAGLSINSSTGLIDLSASSPGTYSVINSIPASGGCPSAADTSTITINAVQNAAFTYPLSAYCQTGTDPSPTITGISGGTFSSSPAGLMINASTGLINLSASALNSYTISYTTPGPCPGTANFSLAITAAPAATFSYAGPYCQNGTDPSPAYSGGGVAGAFSAAPAGLSINASTGLVDLSASAPGTYTVTNTISAAGGCPATSATAGITIDAPDVAVFNYPALQYCQAATDPSPVYSGGGIAGAFTFSPSGLIINSSTGTVDLSASAPGTYIITNTVPASGACPAVTDTTGIIITGPPNVSVNSLSICSGQAATLTASGAGTYSWSTGGSGATISVSPASSATYTVTGTTIAGCSDTAVATVTIVSVPVAAAAGANACAGQSIPLTASGGGTYSWSGPAGFTSSLQNPVISNPGVTNSGTYLLTVSNGTCSDTAQVNVTVFQLPVISITPDITITLGNSTSLAASGGGTYSWFPATDLSCSNCPNPAASPAEATTYCVAVDSLGCSDTACVRIFVEIPCPTNKDLPVPNAFSPNGDGHNDIFCLQGWSNCIREFTIYVYDRWGEKVFESTDAAFCWDGIYHGKMLDPAVFVYFIKASFSNDNKIEKKGNISLIR